MKLHGACLKTHNIKQMVDFYSKVFEHEPEIDGGVDFRFLPEQLIVFKLDDESAPPTRNAALIYAADDVDAEYRRLVSHGIAVDNPPTDKPWGVRSFIVSDPDGNTVSFTKSLV